MPKKPYSVAQITNMVGEVDVLLAHGTTVLEVGRGFGVSEQNDYRCRPIALG